MGLFVVGPVSVLRRGEEGRRRLRSATPRLSLRPESEPPAALPLPALPHLRGHTAGPAAIRDATAAPAPTRPPGAPPGPQAPHCPDPIHPQGVNVHSETWARTSGETGHTEPRRKHALSGLSNPESHRRAAVDRVSACARGLGWDRRQVESDNRAASSQACRAKEKHLLCLKKPLRSLWSGRGSDVPDRGSRAWVPLSHLGTCYNRFPTPPPEV